ncbi:M4 family metallopeptidase, partial [Streptomyces collinus]
MSRIRHVRGSRLALAGVALTGTTALLAAVLSPAAGAADRPTRSGAIEDAEAVLADRAGALGLTSAQETEVRDVVVDEDGTRHVRYDRTYHRLPVLGGDFVLHLNPDGTYRGTSRATTSTLSLASVTPKVTAPKAADLAANLLRAAHLGETLKKLTAKPRLVVDALHGAPKLAWQTDAVAHDERGNPVGRTVLTDATTGDRIDAWDSMESASGDGKSLYGGTVPLETTASGSSYQLKDATRGGTYTGDAENKTDKCLLTVCLTRAPATLFTDADNQWGTGTAADRSTVAVDAQYGTDVTWDYYKKVHGRGRPRPAGAGARPPRPHPAGDHPPRG